MEVHTLTWSDPVQSDRMTAWYWWYFPESSCVLLDCENMSSNIFTSIKWIYYASYTLCMNLDKSGAKHESHIVYTQVIRIWLVPDLIRDSSIRNHWWFLHEPSTDTNLICTDLSVMRLSLYTVCAFWRIFSLFWKFLNSSWLINYQLIGLWLFVMVRRWVHESWIWRIREQCIEIGLWRYAIHNLFARMVHEFQIRANHA